MSSHPHSEDCRAIFAQLSAYLDLDLPPDACQQIRQHLEGCPPCIEFVESLRKTIELCRQYEPGDVPPALTQGARAALLGAYRRALADGPAR